MIHANRPSGKYTLYIYIFVQINLREMTDSNPRQRHQSTSAVNTTLSRYAGEGGGVCRAAEARELDLYEQQDKRV